MTKHKVSSSVTSPDFLFEAQTGFYKYLAVKAALDARIFDNLSEPATAFDVAEAVGGDRGVVDRLLQALWAMGLVERHADGFVNSPAARKFCVRSSPDCLAGVFDFTHACFGRIYQEQASRLCPREDDGLWDESAFIRGVRAGERFARVGATDDTTRFVASLPLFAQARTMLDLGCGAGTLSLEIARTRGDLSLTLLDLPPVLEETRRVVARYGLEHRTVCVAADMFQDDIPGKHDLVFASDSLYGTGDLEGFLFRLRNNVNPGGTVVLRHLESSCDAEAPLHNALLRFGGSLIGMKGYVFPAGVIPHALERAGFVYGESRSCSCLGHAYTTHVAYQAEDAW